MKKILAYLILLVVAVACDDDANNPSVPAPGTYTGKFFRSIAGVSFASSDVTLTLTADRFSGGSDKIELPAICFGTYNVEGDRIKFQNECVWTMDVNRTYILSGEFQIEIDGGKLKISRQRNGLIDQYILNLQ